MIKTKNPTGGIIIGGHVQGLDLVRSLGQKNIPTIVIDIDNCIARYSKYCKQFFRCPDYKSKEFIDFLMKLASQNNYKGWVLYPTNDYITYNIARNKNTLKSWFKIITPDFNIVSNFYSKRKTIEQAIKNGVPCPATWFPENIDLKTFNLEFPVFVRGIEGLAFYKEFSQKVIRASNKTELEETLSLVEKRFEIKNVMVQEIIPFNPELRGVYFTSFCVKGEIKTHFVWQKIREHPLRHGTSTFCKSVANPDLFNISKDLLKDLNYTGVSEIEYVRDPKDNKYKLIEINGRTFLQSSLSRRSGVDYGLIIYKYLNNLPIEYPEVYTPEISWSHFWTDFFFGIQGIIKKEHKLSKIIKSYSGQIEFGVLSFRDMMPFIMETILLPYIAKKRL